MTTLTSFAGFIDLTIFRGSERTYPGVLVTLLISCLAIIGEVLVKGGHISIFSGGLANIKVLGLFLWSLAVYTLLWHLANCDK